jgi:deferrochelatase/peroxidase EfeB
MDNRNREQRMNQFRTYPTGNVRSTLQEPNNFIVPTGGAYFFVPSIAALENQLSA